MKTTARKGNRQILQDAWELSRVLEVLVRLRHQQGAEVVEGAVKEAARLEWRFCQACGTEEPHEGDLCAGCGRSANQRLGNAQAVP